MASPEESQNPEREFEQLEEMSRRMFEIAQDELQPDNREEPEEEA